MEDKLIEAVQKRPCLFDKKSVLYRNKLAKERAWRQVSQVVGVNVKDCMGRWRSLRDRFVRETTKLKDGELAGRPTWCHLKKMSFVQKHIALRRSLPYVENAAEEEESELAELDFSETVGDKTTGNFEISIIKRTDQNYSNDESYEEEILPVLQQQRRCDTPLRPETPPKKRRKMQENAHERFENLCSTVTDFIESKKQSYRKSRNEDFLKVLDSYLLKLPDEEQDRLKIQILNLVYENS